MLVSSLRLTGVRRGVWEADVTAMLMQTNRHTNTQRQARALTQHHLRQEARVHENKRQTEEMSDDTDSFRIYQQKKHFTELKKVEVAFLQMHEFKRMQTYYSL